jgi:hypothetical protein
VFPKPTGAGLGEYLAWDDWRVLGLLASGEGGEHGKRLMTRNHFRSIYHTPEVSTLSDLEILQQIREKLRNLIVAEESASKSWYKTGTPDIPVIGETNHIAPLSSYSMLLANLKANNQTLVYVRPEHAIDARSKVKEIVKQI